MLADELLLLVQLDSPGHAGSERRRLRVRVLADDEMLLLQAQDALWLQPERPDALGLPGDQDRVPYVLPVGGREVDLVPELTDEADPHQQRVDAGHSRLTAVEIGERLR